MKKKRRRKRCLLVGLILAVLVVAVFGFVNAYLTDMQTITVPGAGRDIAAIFPVGDPSWAKISGGETATIERTEIFSVTVAAEYTGDLWVNVVLLNQGDLDYAFLNMLVVIEDNTASQVGRVELITLENDGASFALLRGVEWSDPYTVTIAGGSRKAFKAIPGGGSLFLSPSFHAEVSQR